MKHHTIILITFLATVFACHSAQAQKKNTVKQKVEVKQKTATLKVAPQSPAEPTAEDIVFDNLLPSTAKIQFIDSTDVSLYEMTQHLPLPASLGKVYAELKDSVINYVYENDFGLRRIVSLADKKGIHKLYTVNKLGKSWSKPKPLNIPGDFTDLICPFLMPDGQTLYFAAKGGDDNLGGHDIFFTIYDSDEDKFITPQSLGLPYNSKSHDYYCIIDESNQLGYLLTQRRKKKGYVSLYTFIPTETREIYAEDGDISDEELRQYAEIRSIKATQKNKNEVIEASNRLNKIKSSLKAKATSGIEFIVNSRVIYHSLADFRSASNKSLYQEVLKQKANLAKDEALLAEMRIDFHNGNHAKKNDIINLENRIQDERVAIRNAEKDIRNKELKLIK